MALATLLGETATVETLKGKARYGDVYGDPSDVSVVVIADVDETLAPDGTVERTMTVQTGRGAVRIGDRVTVRDLLWRVTGVTRAAPYPGGFAAHDTVALADWDR